MRHWKLEINFEAWDEEDAERMRRRMIAPVEAEDRLLFSGEISETTEFHTGEALADPRKEEFSESSFALRPAGIPPPGFRWDGERGVWMYSAEWLSPPEE